MHEIQVILNELINVIYALLISFNVILLVFLKLLEVLHTLA